MLGAMSSNKESLFGYLVPAGSGSRRDKLPKRGGVPPVAPGHMPVATEYIPDAIDVDPIPVRHPRTPWEKATATPPEATSWWVFYPNHVAPNKNDQDPEANQQLASFFDAADHRHGMAPAPGHGAILLSNETVNSSTLLCFPGLQFIDAITSRFVGPSNWSFFQPDKVVYVPVLTAERPILRSDGKQATDQYGMAQFERCQFELPPAIRRQHMGECSSPDTLPSTTIFNDVVASDPHMQRFRASNYGPWSHSTNYGLAGLTYPRVSLRPAFLRPALSAPGVGDPLPADSSKSYLFDFNGSQRLGTRFTKHLADLALVVVRPYPDEWYCLYQPVAGNEVDWEQANPVVKKRTEWKYIVSVYLRLDSVKGCITPTAQQHLHEFLTLFPATRHSVFDQNTDSSKLNQSFNPVICLDPVDFAQQVDRVAAQRRANHVPVIDPEHHGRPAKEGVVQLGPGGPFYDPVSGLFSAKYGPLDPRARHAGFLASQIQPRPNGSSFVINVARDVTASRSARLTNVFALVSAFPLTIPRPIPAAHHPRLPSRATLIVAAPASVAHWEQAASQNLLSPAKIVVLSNHAQLSSHTLADLLLADVAILSQDLTLDPFAWPSSQHLDRLNVGDTSEVSDAILESVINESCFELYCKLRGSSFSFAQQLPANLFAPFWYRIVIDDWCDLPSMNRHFVGQSWVLLDSPSETSMDRKAIRACIQGWSERGIFVDCATPIKVQPALFPEAPSQPPSIARVTVPVVPSPLEQVIRDTANLAANHHAPLSQQLLSLLSDNDRFLRSQRSSFLVRKLGLPASKHLLALALRLTQRVQDAIHDLQSRIRALHNNTRNTLLIRGVGTAFCHALGRTVLEADLHSAIRNAVQSALDVCYQADAADEGAVRYDHVFIEDHGYAAGTVWQGVLRRFATLREDVIALSEAYKKLDTCRFALERIRAACKAEAWLDKIVEKRRPVEEIKCRNCHHYLSERHESGERATLVFFPNAQGAQCSRCCFPSTLDDAGVLVMDPFPILARLRALDRGDTNRSRMWVPPLVSTAYQYLADTLTRPESGHVVLVHSPTNLPEIKAVLRHHGLPCISLSGRANLYSTMKSLLSHGAPDAVRIALIPSDMDLKSLARIRIPNVTHILVLCAVSAESLTQAMGVTLRPVGEIQRDVTIVSFDQAAGQVDVDFSVLPSREWE